MDRVFPSGPNRFSSIHVRNVNVVAVGGSGPLRLAATRFHEDEGAAGDLYLVREKVKRGVGIRFVKRRISDQRMPSESRAHTALLLQQDELFVWM
jgi:hypothetical protein